MISIRLRLHIILPFLLLFLTGPASAGNLPKSIQSKDGTKMILIPEGTYDMGSNDEDLLEIAPVHRVFISAFYMDEHPVTNGQFAKFLNEARPTEGPEGSRLQWVALRSDLKDKEMMMLWPTEITFEFDKYVAYKGYKDYPVITISWTAADAYCKWAGKRLPTEAEWEKAARGGLIGKQFPWGDEIPTDEIIFGKSWKTNQSAAPLGNAKSGKPNGYGLYNMAGNVWEWCFDWFSPDSYQKSGRKDPKGPEGGDFKVLRGGSWFNNPPGLRVGLRNWLDYRAIDESTGFRCASDAPDNMDKKQGAK